MTYCVLVAVKLGTLSAVAQNAAVSSFAHVSEGLVSVRFTVYVKPNKVADVDKLADFRLPW